MQFPALCTTLLAKALPLRCILLFITGTQRHSVFHSLVSISVSIIMIQNTFWYVWLSYFKVGTSFCLEGILKEIRFQAKPDPNDLSRLFRLTSENFMSLHCSILGGQKHKDEAFIVRTLIYSLSHMCVTYILYV